MKHLVFSVIVPAYNAEKYIGDCIRSVQDQTYQYWELLIINDGSTDSTARICNAYAGGDSRIKVITKPNGGVSSARNMGLDNAKGDIITFVDSDDTIASSMLERIVQVMETENADLVFNDFKMVYSDRAEHFKTHPWTADKERSFAGYLTKTWPRVPWGGVKFGVVEGMRYPENLAIFEDFYFICQVILKANKIVRIPEPLYEYRQTNESSVTHTLCLERKEADFDWVYDNLLKLLKSERKYDMFLPAIYHRLLYMMQAYILEGELEKFRIRFPDKRTYIWTCPAINIKMKIMMWCVVNHLSYLTLMIVKVRRLLSRG